MQLVAITVQIKTMATLVIKIKRSFWQQVLYVIMWPWKRFTSWLIKKLLSLRAKLQIGSLREAIGLADKDKEKTGRKNIVVFNSHSGKYEPLQKKGLKRLAENGKNKSNKAMTDGRKRVLAKQKRKKRIIDQDKVKSIEEKSLYVTK
jgi:hypothetical protein